MSTEARKKIKAFLKERKPSKVYPHLYWKNREIFDESWELTSWKLMDDKWDCARIWNKLCDLLGMMKDSYEKPVREDAEVKKYLNRLTTDYSVGVCWRERPHYNVMFSNGYDSTALIISHLEKGEYVIPFYVSFLEGTEVWAQLTIKQLQKIYPKLLHDLVPLFSPVLPRGECEAGFAQQSFVAFYASKIGRCYQEDAITEVAFCMNDDAISYLDDLKGLYQKGLDCTYPKNKGCPLEFPLIKTKHIDNFELVDAWQSKNNTVLFCNELDCCDLDYYWNIDKEGNLWGMILNKGEPSKKENKLCYRNITAIAVKFKDIAMKEGVSEFIPLRN